MAKLGHGGKTGNSKHISTRYCFIKQYLDQRELNSRHGSRSSDTGWPSVPSSVRKADLRRVNCPKHGRQMISDPRFAMPPRSVRRSESIMLSQPDQNIVCSYRCRSFATFGDRPRGSTEKEQMSTVCNHISIKLSIWVSPHIVLREGISLF
jgi:hypothetical protein